MSVTVPLPSCILIVEDEILIAEQLESELRAMGIAQIHIALNSSEARRIWENTQCDFVLMDINLDDETDGIALSREFMTDRKVPVVFVTAYTDDEFFEETLELAPYGFIGKPFSEVIIKRTIKMAYQQYLHQQRTPKNKTIEGVLYLQGGYRYDLTKKILYHRGRSILLQSRMRKFVDLMCKNPHTIMTHDVLLYQLWGEGTSMSSLRTLIYDLRKKLPDFPLVTHSKMGYSLAISSQETADD